MALVLHGRLSVARKRHVSNERGEHRFRPVHMVAIELTLNKAVKIAGLDWHQQYGGDRLIHDWSLKRSTAQSFCFPSDNIA